MKSNIAVRDALGLLPSGAKGWAKPSEWLIQAEQTARKAISELKVCSPFAQISAAARQAVQSVARVFEYGQQCIDVMNKASTRLKDANTVEREKGYTAVREAVLALPLFTNQHEIDHTRDL